MVRNNINNSFPEKTKEEKRKIEIGFYHHFSDMLVEIPKLLTMSHKEIQRRIKFENYETMLKQYNDGKSVILMAAHCGNWEWMTSLSLILPDDKPMYQVYKKLRNKVSDNLFYTMRKVCGSESVEMNDLLRKMVEMKNEGKQGIFAMISDQSPRYTSNLHFINFLNQSTAIIQGSEHLAKKFNFLVYYGSIQKIKRGNYLCKFELITAEPQKTASYEITEKYMSLLERDIKRQPEIWLWSHKRWKHKLIN